MGEQCDNCVKPLCNERHKVCNNRFESIERNQGELYGLARQATTSQAKTEGKVDTLITKVDSMDKNLFAFLQLQTKTQTKEREAERTERSKLVTLAWEFAKWVVAATVGAVIIRIFTGGGI